MWKNRKTLSILVVCAAVVTAFSIKTFSHCEIPCGIYGDEMRFEMIKEHVTTIEKSMQQIEELSADPKENANQLTRWISNKEKHANELQHIVTQYFMTQRVIPADEGDENYAKYQKQLELLHKMLVHAMKSKQTTDLEHVEELRSLLNKYHKVYFGDDHEH